MAFDLARCCIVLLLDRNYIPGARVLLSSLKISAALGRLPIIVMSDDDMVLQDPIIGARAAKMIKIDESFVARYADLPTEHIPERQRREAVPKYTWLKFAIYRDFGYDANIFIDSDMFFVRSPDEILARLQGLDFEYAAAPNIERTIWEGVKSAELFGSRWNDFVAGTQPYQCRPFNKRGVSFNSGFSIASGRVLSEEYVQKLFEVAKRGGTQYEQRINWIVMRDMGINFCELPVHMNVTRPIGDLAARFGQTEIENSIVNHHLIFKKPWDKTPADFTPTDRMWAAEAVAGLTGGSATGD